MMTFRSVETVAFAAIVAAALMAACTTTDTGYVNSGRGGGWESFRAEALPAKPVPWSVT